MAIFNPLGREAEIIGALDIGTAKVCCMIAARDRDQPVLLGIGHQRARGLKSGMVVDADEAERSIRAAVGQAERMAGVSLDRVVASVSCGRVRSASFTARATVETPVVRAGDVDRILGAGEAYPDRSGRTVIQLMRSDWRLDGATGIADPCGLAGRDLAIDLTAVTLDDGPLRNLLGVIERSHLTADRLVASGYASALAVTSEDERRVGTLVVEMGAGVTSLAAFAEGRLVHLETIPVGGNHVTYDLARELVTTVPEAERIKTLYGTLVKAASNDSEIFSYLLAGDDQDATHHVSKAFVGGVIEPRISGLVELVAERLTEARLDAHVANRIVLTGGASQLLGLDQVWSRRFSGTVRIGRPLPIGRMLASMCSPAFSTVLGLVGIAREPKIETDPRAVIDRRRRDLGYVDRMHRWIAESF
ncbi:MAG: cell division protein FtsA [Hyphomicrobiaceae bacterium]